MVPEELPAPRVRASAPVAARDGLHIADTQGVDAVGQNQGVIAGCEVDGYADVAAAKVRVSSPVPPVTDSTFCAVTVLVPSARVRLSVPEPRLTVSACQCAAESDRISTGAAVQGFDVADGQGIGAICQVQGYLCRHPG